MWKQLNATGVRSVMEKTQAETVFHLYSKAEQYAVNKGWDHTHRMMGRKQIFELLPTDLHQAACSATEAEPLWKKEHLII